MLGSQVCTSSSRPCILRSRKDSSLRSCQFVHYFIFWLCVCSGFLRRPEEDQISWCWSCRWLWAAVRTELWSSVSVVLTPNWRHFSSPWLNIFETGSHYVGPADLKFVSASSYSRVAGMYYHAWLSKEHWRPAFFLLMRCWGHFILQLSK